MVTRSASGLPAPARLAVTAIFFVNGMVIGSFAARIPAIKEGLGLSDGTLGLALLAAAVGALTCMPFAGGLVAQLGSRRMTTLGVLACCAALPLSALAPNLLLLAPALFALGASNGTLDVSMNSQGVAVEKLYRRPILSSFHAAFSFGALAGAVTGGAAAAAGISLRPHLIGVAAVLIPIAFVATRWLLPTSADASDGGPSFARPSGRLVALGIVAFCGLVAEGAMSDWSAVYLNGPLKTNPAVAAWGFGAFSLTMALGRLVGDRLTEMWGPAVLTRRSGLVAAAGLGMALLLGRPIVAIIGFACVGAGLATVVPVVFSAAGRTSELPPGPAIAAVATCGYTGFLAGPPSIGLTASLLTLPVALGIVVFVCVMIAVLAPSVGTPEKKTAPHPKEAQPLDL